MGVGIFAARKISLLNSINNMEMMMMQISSQSQKLTDKATQLAMQQLTLQSNASAYNAGGGNNWGAIGQMAAGLGGGIGALAGGQQNGAVYSQVGSLAGSAVGLVGTLLSGRGSGGNGMQDYSNQNANIERQLLQINQQEKRLQTTMKTLESQLMMKNKEYESVEKAEEKAIQRSAPKYDA